MAVGKITNYATLKTNVQTYLAYDDIEDMYETFLGLTEARIRRDIRIREMEAQADVTFNASSSYTFPSGFLEIIDLYETGSTGRTLEYLPPQKFYSLTVSRSGTGQPVYYTIIGDEIRVAPLTDSTARTYSLNYFKQFDVLDSATTTTNTLLTLAPDVYLYGILFEAQPYLVDRAREEEFDALYRRAIDGLHAADIRARHRPRGRIHAEGVVSDGAFRI